MAKSKKPVEDKTSKKIQELAPNIFDGDQKAMTTDQGLKINDDQNSLKSGDRGATLLEDFILREKITHFDHERIPERIVHARGSGAHGIFKLYKPLGEYTKARFLNDTSITTPVFVRFSTVAGSKGSTDLARDARGFAVKFYTDEGNYDLVGNNIPVFFIQDAMKFPDLVHAVKAEPHNEIPQAASAHNTFWDFISLMPESMHMIMWAMSDRGIPRSLRMMEGFGVHTFRFINDKNKSHFVKFHWKPLLGVHSVAWDEAQRISGKDSDFHKRDLWEAIKNGQYPEWELGVQIVPEKDEHKFPFDLLDPTKIIPEEMVPVMRIGKMTLNRNPDNFFSETEQVAFHPGHLVPGIDFTNDPLLQGRLFSYTDTQLSRLGSPNFHEIPINRSVQPIYNNQRDGHMRMQINKGASAYSPNSLGGGCPFQSKAMEGGFTSFEERVDSRKIRARSKSFFDHFSQATLFYNSQSDAEKRHLQNALSFELSKVEHPYIRERIIGFLNYINQDLGKIVAGKIGVSVPKLKQPLTGSIPADGSPNAHKTIFVEPYLAESKALSMANTVKDTIQSRRVAIFIADGTNSSHVQEMKTALEAGGAMVKLIAPVLGTVKMTQGKLVTPDEAFFNTASVLYDAVYVPGGNGSSKLLNEADAVHFIGEAFKHCKAIAANDEGVELLKAILPEAALNSKGVIINKKTTDFINAIKQHRFWERETGPGVPA